jgi:pimeloyl-ACP methyl ester carboxylesterase
MRRIGGAVADVELLGLPDCRHSPHRDQPDAVVNAIARFVERIRARYEPARPGARRA